MTAAQMKKMMEGVVLFGTARRAILNGYTSAGKTGTAQKVDPATGVYSKTKYVASFIGFSPVNNPAVTIAVILDSPIGLHQGGQVSAPVFKRIAEQVLEYMHVPHDVDVKRAAADIDGVSEGAMRPTNRPTGWARLWMADADAASTRKRSDYATRRAQVTPLADVKATVQPAQPLTGAEHGAGTPRSRAPVGA